MSTQQLIGTPLATKPYLELLQRAAAGDPGNPRYIYPKLVTTPKRMKASRSQNRLALVTDLRASDIDALGTGKMDAVIPETGIRVFDNVGRFLFFGADGSKDPIMFERAGLFYTDTDIAAELPVAPAAVSMACFSKGGRYFFAVSTGAPSVVDHWGWTAAEVDDPNGIWEPRDPLATTGTVTRIWVSPLNTYLVVQTATQFFRFKVEEGLDAVGASPGRLIGCNADETLWLWETGGDVQVGTLASDVLTAVDNLPSSGGTNLRCAFSPDGKVITILGNPASGSESPRFYTTTAGGDYVYTRGVTRSGAVTALDVAVKDDSQIAIATADSAGSRVELYKRDTITPDPFTPDGLLFAAGTGSTTDTARSRDGVFGALGSLVIRWNGSSYDTVTPSGYASGRGRSLSGDGGFLLTATSTGVLAWKWDGSAYAAIASPLAANTTVRAVALSHSGLICALVLANGTAGTLRFMQYSVSTNTWTQIGSDIAFSSSAGTTIGYAEFAPNRDDLVAISMQGITPLVYKLTSGAFVLQSALPVPSGYTYSLPFAWAPGGDYLAVALRNSSLNWRLCVFFYGSDGTFTLAFQSGTLVNGTVAQQLMYAVDGKHLVWAHGSSSTPGFVWSVSGATYASVALSGVPTVSMTGVLFMPKHMAFLGANTSPKWIYDMSGTLQTYVVDQTFALTGSGLATFLTYSPTKSVLHYGRANDAHHRNVTAPFAEATALSFAPGLTPSQVSNVLYSPSGKDVVFDAPTGPQVAVRSSLGSDFVNAKNIEGVFVFTYYLDGDTYREFGYSQHKWSSIVKDPQFALDDAVFSYHVNVPDAAPDAAQGRLVYYLNLSDGMSFKGQIWEPEMTDSLIAYSPWNTHFVVTHEHLTTNDPVITLHEFNGDHTFTLRDTKEVSFGPPDFSKCDDVVVAHGGVPPLSFFKHDGVNEILIPRTVTINWDFDGVILDVAFRDDCGGMIILTPDELIPLEDDEEDDEITADDPTPLEEPLDPDTDTDKDIDVDPDGDITIDPGVIDPTYPGYYHHDPDDKDLYSISYVPYSVVTVTFRVASIPS